MQSNANVHIAPTEWRWVISAGSLLVLLAFMPFLWIMLQQDSTMQFMGMIGVNYIDGGTYLSKMIQGEMGSWSVRFLHTPEPDQGALLQTLYPLLGSISGVAGLSHILMFHIARVIASLFMYLAIYQFAATVWSRARSRQIFFIITSLGAGFGWLLILFNPNSLYPDIGIPEAFPLFSSFVNVHFPLTIACLALLASIIIRTFRPGIEENPGIYNGGLGVLGATVALGVLYPQTLIPFAGALTLSILLNWARLRRAKLRDVWWWLLIAVPTTLITLYYLVVANSNPILAEWNAQNLTPAPNPFELVMGFGLTLILAAPAIIRAARRLDPDGDQFMLLWLVVMLVALYLPFNVQRRFMAGMMLLIAYFATRGLEDFWFQRISRTWRGRLSALLLPVMSFSFLFVLFGPVIFLRSTDGMMLNRDYTAVFTWLRDNGASGEVVLASPNVSLWLPGWTGDRVVYGHPFETMNAAEKEALVIGWFTTSDSDECQRLLNGEYAFNDMTYRVQYVLVGDEERRLTNGDANDPAAVESPCLDGLTELVTFGSVTLYGR